MQSDCCSPGGAAPPYQACCRICNPVPCPVIPTEIKEVHCYHHIHHCPQRPVQQPVGGCCCCCPNQNYRPPMPGISPCPACAMQTPPALYRPAPMFPTPMMPRQQMGGMYPPMGGMYPPMTFGVMSPAGMGGFPALMPIQRISSKSSKRRR